MREALGGKLLDGGMQRVHAANIADRVLHDDIGTRSGRSRCVLCSRSFVMTGIFERLRHSQFADPNWQPVLFAVLLLLISVTLVLIITNS